MRLISTHSYFGPNRYVNKSAIRFLLDVSENQPFQLRQDFAQQLALEIPESKKHLDAFYKFTDSGHTKIENIESILIELFHSIIIRLFSFIDENVNFLECKTSHDIGQLQLLYTCDDLDAGLQAGELALKILDNVFVSLNGQEATVKDFILPDRIQKFTDQVLSRQYDLTAKAILKTAKNRQIPVFELTKWPFSKQPEQTAHFSNGLFQLGHGCHQKLIKGTLTNSIASQDYSKLNNRQIVFDLLSAKQLPFPAYDNESTNINSLRRVLRSVNKIGYPVVLKTRHSIPAVGSMVKLKTDNDVVEAYQYLSHFDRHVIVHKFIEGQNYRLLVINNEVVAACKYHPNLLVGDGIHTLNQLLQNYCNSNNTNPANQPSSNHSFNTTTAHLIRKGIDPDKIPARNELIPLHVYPDNLIRIHQKDVLRIINDQTARLAVKAAEACSLPVLGIDLISADITQHPEQSNTFITAIDPAPDLTMHCLENEHVPVHAAGRFLSYLFPNKTTGRIPIVAVTGTNGKTTTCRMVTNILKTAGLKPGLACTDGVYLNDKRINEHTSSGISGAMNVFTSRNIDAAVLETSRGTLLQKGLAFDYCNVAACTNIANDHLGIEGIETLDQMANLKRVVVESARDWVVLNAEDQNCLSMIPHLKCKTLCLVSLTPSNPVLSAHIEQGNPAVFLQQQKPYPRIMIALNNSLAPLLSVEEMPASWQGKALHNIANAMFAAAIALGLNISINDIKKALCSQGSSIVETPGRLNLFDTLPFKVILDYAHNGHGLNALSHFIRNIECRGKKILVLFFRDNMRENDVLEAAEAVADNFDLYICRDSANDENEYTGNTANFLRQCLIQKGVAETQAIVIADPRKALNFALKTAQANDLIVYNTGPKAKIVWQQLEEYQKSHFPDRVNSKT